MSDTRDLPSAFDRIAPELGDLLARLGQAITAPETLALRDKITETLSDAGLG